MVAKMFDDDYYEGAGAAEDEKLPGRTYLGKLIA